MFVFNLLIEEAEDHSDGVVVVDLKTVVDVFSQSIHVGRDDRVPNALCRPFRQCYGITSVYTDSTEAQRPGMLGSRHTFKMPAATVRSSQT